MDLFVVMKKLCIFTYYYNSCLYNRLFMDRFVHENKN